MGSILNVGKSALAAAQYGLVTTSHNIANANTPGYSRQEIVQSSMGGQSYGGAYIGRGVEIASIKRAYDQHLTSQVRVSNSAQAASDVHLRQITLLNNLVGDGSAGVSPALQEFFQGLQNLSSDPNSSAARQTLLAQSENLAARFNALSGQMVEARNDFNDQVLSSVKVVNSYAKQIADLNDRISKSSVDGSAPNDLLDMRDQIIADLSKQIRLTTVPNGETGINVFIGNGQPLVVGTRSNELAGVNSPDDPNRLQLAFRSGSTTMIMAEDGIRGGALGGLFEFRSGTLDNAERQLDRAATVFSLTVNEQHRMGMDQKGGMGGDLFSFQMRAPVANALNASSAVAGASIVDPRALMPSDYKLAYDGSNYSVTRLMDGQVTALSGVPQVVDGVSFTIASGAPAAGDSFLVQPLAEAAAKMKVAITDKSQLALASPIVTAAPTSNLGNAKISVGAVDQTYSSSPLGAPVSISFTAGVPPAVDTISGFPGGPLPYTSGSTISFGGVSFSITGTPANGDTFTVGPNSIGASDSGNVGLLGALQSAKNVEGVSTIQGAYADFVGSIGNKTRELAITKDAEDKLLDESTKARDAQAGVNLDEEAANLLRYQQAYQAAGKVVQTADKMFDVLLSLV